MSSRSAVVSNLNHTVLSVLRSERYSSHTHEGRKTSKQRGIIRQAIFIEAAVAATLIVYIAWVCFRGWYFKEPIVTPDSMLMGSVLVLIAALSAKLCWIVWSTLQSWFESINN